LGTLTTAGPTVAHAAFVALRNATVVSAMPFGLAPKFMTLCTTVADSGCSDSTIGGNKKMWLLSLIILDPNGKPTTVS